MRNYLEIEDSRKMQAVGLLLGGDGGSASSLVETRAGYRELRSYLSESPGVREAQKPSFWSRLRENLSTLQREKPLRLEQP
jgi:hypothetical protein